MVERVDLDAQPFLEPGLQLRVVRVDPAGHDADRGAAVDLLQPVEDRPQVRLVLGSWSAHVVDRQDDDRLDALLADPLRRDQLGERGGT